jgi:hypothetical protein
MSLFFELVLDDARRAADLLRPYNNPLEHEANSDEVGPGRAGTPYRLVIAPVADWDSNPGLADHERLL